MTHYLTAPRGFYGRGRPKSVAHRCPACNRVLLPTSAHEWPFHYIGDVTLQQWCDRSGTQYPTEET